MGAGDWWLRIMGRLKPGATIEQGARVARSRVSTIRTRPPRGDVSCKGVRAGFNRLASLSPKTIHISGAMSGSRGEMGGRQFFAKPLRLLLGCRRGGAAH
jgi:hypothetical protein